MWRFQITQISLKWKWKKIRARHEYLSDNGLFLVKRDFRYHNVWWVYNVVKPFPDYRLKKATKETFGTLFEAKYFAEYGVALGYRPMTLNEKLQLIRSGDGDALYEMCYNEDREDRGRNDSDQADI